MLLSACAQQAPPEDWRAIIARKDVDHMRDWRKEWVDALAKAKEEGNAAAIAAYEALGFVPRRLLQFTVVKRAGAG